MHATADFSRSHGGAVGATEIPCPPATFRALSFRGSTPRDVTTVPARSPTTR